MNKLKERIYIKQWLDLKPYNNQVSTDIYYLKLCNEVKHSIITHKQSFLLQIHLDNDEINLLSCFLTSYFEDLISETTIWNTFIKIHKKLYRKRLPFYDADEYFEQEINFPDVCFLIWYFINSIQQDKFIAPINDFILETSKKVMEVFDNAWDYAPENKHLKTFYSIDVAETDFYVARNLIDTILFKSYLFYPDTLLDLRYSELEIIEDIKKDDPLIDFLNENRDHKLHNSFTRLLGLKGQEWVAEILGENHPLSNDFLKISPKIRGYFFYRGQDEKNVFLEHIASGRKFNLTKKSFDHSDELKDLDSILYIGIVLWRNEWWFSGVYFQPEFNADLILDEKNSLESRSAVNFLDYQDEDTSEILGKQLKAFKEFNDDQQIVFMNSDKIESYISDFIEFFNNSLSHSKKEKEEAKQRARAEGYFGNDNEMKDFSEMSENGLVFFNPQSGVEIALEVSSAFPIKNNPFYEENESIEHIMRLFYTVELSTELAMYCINNFSKELKFFKSAEGKLYLENIDFLLRYWKKGNYFTKPAITFTGKEN